MSENKKLVALRYNHKRRTISFRYEKPGWVISEKFHPSSVRETLRTTLETVEEAIPGSIAKAAELDDANQQFSKKQERRYVAETPDLLYLGSPHLAERYAELAGDYYVDTHHGWPSISKILNLICDAADIRFDEAARKVSD